MVYSELHDSGSKQGLSSKEAAGYKQPHFMRIRMKIDLCLPNQGWDKAGSGQLGPRTRGVTQSKLETGLFGPPVPVTSLGTTLDPGLVYGVEMDKNHQFMPVHLAVHASSFLG